MNKSDAEREYSDADPSVVEFLTGKSHAAVKIALMPAVVWVSLLIANHCREEIYRKNCRQLFFWSGVHNLPKKRC